MDETADELHPRDEARGAALGSAVMPPFGDAAADEPEEGRDAAAPDADGPSQRLAHIIESVLFAAAGPVSLRRLIDILAGPTSREVQTALAQVKERYAPGNGGIQLHEVAGGYQLRTARENAEWVRAIFREKPARLGRAALETLAIVAYKQPVTRADIEIIRGVDVDGVLTTLLSRRLIKIAGRKEAVGRPLLYATTPEFLETFGLKDLGELPALKELGPGPETEDGSSSSPTYGDPTDAAPGTQANEGGAPAAAAPTAGSAPAHDPATGSATAVASDAVADATVANAAAASGALAGAPRAGAFAAGAATTAGDTGAAPAEAPQPRGNQLAAAGGGADPRGASEGERAGGDAARDEGEPAHRPDHD